MIRIGRSNVFRRTLTAFGATVFVGVAATVVPTAASAQWAPNLVDVPTAIVIPSLGATDTIVGGPYYYGTDAALDEDDPVYVVPRVAVSADADWASYCSTRYRSFDPADGTFLGYDGLRHPCR